jgi:hypothetical protein
MTNNKEPRTVKTIPLKDQYRVIKWIGIHDAELVALNRNDIVDRCFADTGIACTPAQISRYAEAADVTLTYGRKRRSTPVADDKVAAMATIIRRLGRCLNDLYDKDDIPPEHLPMAPVDEETLKQIIGHRKFPPLIE